MQNIGERAWSSFLRISFRKFTDVSKFHDDGGTSSARSSSTVINESHCNVKFYKIELTRIVGISK